jgi:Phage integrase, N-terminal SAM-like domain
MRGYIRKRSKGSWQISVSAGFDPVTGKRRQVWRTVRGTKKNAEQELTRLLREVDNGTSADPGRITLGEYLERWLDHMRTRVRPRTLERYASIVRGHLTPALGAVPLAKLHPLHIQALYDRLLSSGRLRGEGGLSPRTVHYIPRGAVRSTSPGSALAAALGKSSRGSTSTASGTA